MKNSKLASLLSKLSQKEFKDFGKFLKSPYFNSNSNIIKLYDIIAKYFPELEHEKLSKENLYSFVYPKEKYNDSTTRGLLSSMLKLAEEFLAHESLRNDTFRFNEFMLNELSCRGIHDLFNTNIKSLRTEIETKKSEEEDYYFLRYRMETMVNSQLSKTYVPLTQKDIPGDINANDTDNILIYFFIAILKRYNYLLTKTGSFNVSINLNFLDEIIQYLSKQDLQKTPLLNYHYNRAMMYLSSWDKKYFFALKKILHENYNEFIHEDRYNILGTLQNFLVQKIRAGADELVEEQYELYKFAMEKDILTFDSVEYLHPVLFSNVVSSAINLKKPEEAKEFIHKYTERLDPERKETAVNFNLAKVYFAEKKFDEAIESLSNVQQEDVFYKFWIKSLCSQIYYEKNYTEELILLLDTYKSFLNNNIIINQSLKETHTTYIGFLSRLIKLKDIPDKHELGFLKHEIQNAKTIINKDWLIEKINALLN
jgi:hypothetical protein